MRRKLFVLCLAILILGSFSSFNWAATKAWEGTITIPTYPWQEDINPKFFALENSIIYPYTMQDMLSTEKEDRVYKAIFLENEYLKVTCLPELAGRIYSVLDKTTGEEMFHTNRVVKPGMIAMRGAWISGGIEWNTGPHGHSVTIVTPVNATTRRNKDGSVTLVISNTEKIFRTRWEVFLTLHPGKAYLDEEISMYNPTDFIHPYYFWNCTAFYCLPGTRFIYPMTLGTDHNGTSFYSWPIHEGKDLTWLKNYDRPSSVFAYDCAFDFFGAYDVDLDRGIVQFANHNEVIGKKAWTWGQSGDGIVSQRNLHDGDEQYIEVQSGPLLTQADYGLLKPHEIVQWREWWYPVHGLQDGFEYATRDVAIQRLERDGKLEYRLIATGDFRNAHIEFQQDEKTIYKQESNLSPSDSVIIKTDLDPDECIDIIITDKKDQILASYRSPLPIPERTAPEKDWKSTKPEAELSAEELYLKALLYDKQTNRAAARQWYQKALDIDPAHVESLKGLAVLDMEAGLFDDAIKCLQTAIERNADDGMAWFYLAFSLFKTNEIDEALSCAYQAAKSFSSESLGYDLVGRIYMRNGQYSDAVSAFEKSLLKDSIDKRTLNHLLIANFAAGNKKITHKQAKTFSLSSPTDLVPQAVLALLNKKDQKNLQQCLEQVAGEKEFEIIEASLVFSELGLYKEAYQVLQSFNADQSFQSPVPYYYLALWSDLGGLDDETDNNIRLAETTISEDVFPSRLEAIEAIEFVIKQSATIGIKPANSYLNLGNLYGGLGRIDDAVDMWEKAVSLNSSLNVAWRNLGLAAWKKDKDLTAAADYYRKAIKSRRDDQSLYRDLASILISDQKRPEAIALIENMSQKNLRSDIIEILAQTYVDQKNYTKAIELLDNSFFSNWENRTMSRNVFVRAHIERGKQYLEQKQLQAALDDFSMALIYPTQLGVGKPINPSEAEQLFWKGKTLQAMGKTDLAKRCWMIGQQSRPRSFKDKCRKALSDLKKD
jgi:tetratricopeptide (TPR) repeat protein